MKSIHLDKLKNTPAYHAAKHFSLQMYEYAKTHGYDSKGIRFYNKKDCRNSKIPADCAIVWETGPENWTHTITIKPLPNVSIERYNGHIIVFYDVPFDKGL